MATILVAEDRAAQREELRDLLRKVGHVVELARNGVEALDLYPALSPDVVILDLFMPVMNGFDVLLHLQRLHPEARVIVLSDGGSQISNAALTEAIELGADRAVTKPLQAETLITAIDDLLTTAED